MEEPVKLVSAGDCIQIWDLLSFSPEAHFNPHDPEQEVSSLCWSFNNQFLVSAASGGDRISVSICKTKPVYLWSIAEQGHKTAVTCLTTDWDDQCILSGSLSGDIILHSMLTDEAPPRFCSHSQQPLRDLKFSCFQQSMLGSVGDDGSFRTWDINSLQLQHSFDHVHKAPATALCFSPVIEPLVITVGLDKQISAVDVRSKSVLYCIRADCPLTALELLPDGTALLIGTSRGKVSLYDLRNMEFPVKSSKAHKGAVRCIKLQAVRGKFQAAWPTVLNEVKVGDSSATANDTTNNIVSTLPSDPPSSQVNTITLTKPSPQFRKVIFLARNSFGEVFSPIRSDMNHTDISTTEFSSPSLNCASNCSPQSKNGFHVEKLANLAKLAVKQFSEDAGSTAERFEHVQSLHNCDSKREMIEQKPNHMTLANTLNTPPGQAGEEGTEEWAVSLPKTQLVQNLLKDALEEFSEEHHKEVVGLQLAMIHAFHIQQLAIREALFKHLKVNEELLEEYVTLKEENEWLKAFH
ncbi:protein NEDD1-like isoform X2 [Chiloscyllium plagiosum]|uniref:protein NEDD1-like isoform X2 n=1 Tax=Chiloscyllium plagiosum TaxID=36176 RepID=UPI001CB7FD80|nr:protein NEDD1-like isoform X2 [Chiloscyllium plagiosum]